MLLIASATILTLAVLTAMGERRRGGRFPVVVLAGLFVPFAWIVWCMHDELQQPTSSS